VALQALEGAMSDDMRGFYVESILKNFTKSENVAGLKCRTEVETTFQLKMLLEIRGFGSVHRRSLGCRKAIFVSVENAHRSAVIYATCWDLSER